MTKFPENLMLRLMRTQLAGWHKGSIAEQRARQERSARFFRVPERAQCQAVTADGIPGEWVTIQEASSTTILYLHGGAYALGSVNTHRALVARIAVAAKCSVLAINYRLAPEDPFPAALEDALAAYRWLIGPAANAMFGAGQRPAPISVRPSSQPCIQDSVRIIRHMAQSALITCRLTREPPLP